MFHLSKLTEVVFLLDDCKDTKNIGNQELSVPFFIANATFH